MKILIKLFLIVVVLSPIGALQAQDYEGYIGGNFMLRNAIDSPRGYCLDLEGYAFTTDTSAPVIVHSCKVGFWKDGTWKIDTPNLGQIYSPDFDLCVAAGELKQDAEVFLETCSDSSLQRFVFRDDERVQVKSDAEQTFCLAVATTSRPTGSNLRRQMRMVECDNTEEIYTRWIVPREDTVYPPIN